MERTNGRLKVERRNGQKWVDGNFEAKSNARATNEGTLPYSPALETTDHPISRNWSADDLPEILFYLTPSLSEYQDKKAGYLRDEETGAIVLSEEGRKVRAFEILPRYISLEVEGWMIEAWRRLDSRITYQDIIDRQRSDPDFGGIGLKKLSKNALQNHCYRDCRKVLKNWVEYGRREEPHRTEVESIEELSYNQITYNTILKECSEFPGRLVRVALKQHTQDSLYRMEQVQVTQANFRQTTFEMLHFIQPGLPRISPDNYMTLSMDAAWQMSLLLMERARMHGKQHWSKLGRQCLPVTWFDRLGKDKKTAPNPTYDGGCAVCTWYEGRKEVALANDKKKSHVPITRLKRGRTKSSSNSDEPLIKKRSRACPAEAAVESDHESEAESAVVNTSPQSFRDMSPAGCNAFTTPVRPRQSSVALGRDDKDYDAETEDCGSDSTPGMLSSGKQSTWSSDGSPNSHHQVSPSTIGTYNASTPNYSSPTKYADPELCHIAAVKSVPVNYPQSHWEEENYTNNTTAWPYELQFPQISVVANHVIRPDRPDALFTSSNLNSSFSSCEIDPDSAISSFGTGDEMNEMHLSQITSLGAHSTFVYEPHLDSHFNQMYPPMPGRITAHGWQLTHVLSSPLIRTTSDMDMMSNMYQPSNSTFDSSLPRRHSFAGYIPAQVPVNPYDHSVAADVEWSSGYPGHGYSHHALEAGNQFLEDDYNELPQKAALPAGSESESNAFLALLSSDPVMPEDQDPFDAGVSVENDRFESALFPESHYQQKPSAKCL